MLSNVSLTLKTQAAKFGFLLVTKVQQQTRLDSAVVFLAHNVQFFRLMRLVLTLTLLSGKAKTFLFQAKLFHSYSKRDKLGNLILWTNYWTQKALSSTDLHLLKRQT